MSEVKDLLVEEVTNEVIGAFVHKIRKDLDSTSKLFESIAEIKTGWMAIPFQKLDIINGMVIFHQVLFHHAFSGEKMGEDLKFQEVFEPLQDAIDEAFEKLWLDK